MIFNCRYKKSRFTIFDTICIIYMQGLTLHREMVGMAGKAKDLTGQRFGRLTVIERAENYKGRVMWLCKCDCGTVKPVRSDCLCNGATQSCGCYTEEQLQKRSENSKKLWQREDYREVHCRASKNIWDDEEYRTKMSEKRRIMWQDKEFRAMMSEKRKGSLNPSWNPNLTDEERLTVRENKKRQQWASEVKKEADYTCDCCGQWGGTLHSHHLNDFHTHKESRYEISNGVCLCEKCHREFHHHMGGNHSKCTAEDYYKWKQLKQDKLNNENSDTKLEEIA